MAEKKKKRVRRTKEQIVADLDTQIEALNELFSDIEKQRAEKKEEGKKAIQQTNTDIKTAKKEIAEKEALITKCEATIEKLKKEYADLEESYKKDLKAVKDKIAKVQKKKEETINPPESKMTEIEKALVDRGVDLKTAKATIRMYKKSGMDDAAIKKALNI